MNTLIAIAGVLFGLAEFAPEWTWRPYAQGALAALAAFLGRSPARMGLVPRLVSFAATAGLAIAAWTARSPGLGFLALCLLSGSFGGAGNPRTFAGAALATLGAGTLYLRAPWPQWVESEPALSVLRALPIPRLAISGEWAVDNGTRIHLSAFSILAALPAIAAVLGFRRIRGVALLASAFAAVLIAAATRIGLVLAWNALGYPLWPHHPLVTALFVVLVSGILVYVVPTGTADPPRAPPSTLLWPCTVAAGFLLWIAVSPEKGGAPRTLHVLIDDAHGEWETTQRPYGKERYGRATVYTYTLLRQWLSRRHEVEVATTGPLRPRGDVVVLKMPALPYAKEEQESIQRFVEAGGGLLVIGDHTNLFGTTDHLNTILEPFGLKLRKDAVIPFAGVTRSFRPNWWNASTLVPRGETWDIQTSASIEVSSWRAQPLVIDRAVLGEAAEYSNERNFGDLQPSADDRWPPLVVAAAAAWGKGRIVLLADSTPWSNFSFFAPPNKEVIEAALRLAATPPSSVYRGVALGLILAAGAFLLVRWPFPGVPGALATYALLAAATAPGDGFAITPPRRPAERILVVDGHTGPIDWDTDIRVGKAKERNVYSAFLAGVSRFGAEPEVLMRRAYADALRPVLVLNPTETPSPAQLAEMEAYVREGGRLLVLDDPAQRPGSSGPEILAPFGISYRFEVAGTGLHEAAGPQLPRLVWALPLTLLQETRREPGKVLADQVRLEAALAGVEPLWVDREGLVVCGKRSIGKGKVVVFIRSSVFSQLVMGDVWGGVEPGTEKQRIYDLEYALLREAFPLEAGTPLKEEMAEWER